MGVGTTTESSDTDTTSDIHTGLGIALVRLTIRYVGDRITALSALPRPDHELSRRCGDPDAEEEQRA